MALRVRAVERDADKQILIESFLNVMQGNLAVFDILFNGMWTSAIGGQLRQSNVDGQKQVRDDAAATGATTLVALVQQQIKELGVDKCGKSGERNATKSILWLNRELSFICMLMRLMQMGKDSSEAGTLAYESTLKPFHAWIVQKAVGGAVGYVPKMEEILTLLKIPSKEEGLKQLDDFCGLAEALTTEVLDMLKSEGANFQGTP